MIPPGKYLDGILKLEEMPEVLMQYAQYPYVTVSLPEKQDPSKDSNESKEKGINGILNIPGWMSRKGL